MTTTTETVKNESPARRARRRPSEEAATREEPEAPTIVNPALDEPNDDGSRLYRLIAVLAGAVSLLLVGALIFSVLQIQSQNQANSLRKSALAAATTYGTYLSSYNYSNLTATNSSWSEVDAHATPAFAKRFDSTKSSLSSLVKDYHASATGKVLTAGVSSLSGSRAVVLLFIDQTVTNSAQKPNQSTQPLRVQLVMLHQNGQWRIDDVEVPS